MRILVISNIYPPVASGGYERECAGVVDHLRQNHEVLVMTSRHRRRSAPTDPSVRRVLPFLPFDWRGSLRAPVASVRAAGLTKRVMDEFQPHLVYVWNGSLLPAATVLTAGRAGVPLAFRVCEYWFGDLETGDQFMRHLRPGDRGLRGLWARLIRVVDRVPSLRLSRSAHIPATICWNSEFVRRATPVPTVIVPLLEDLIYPATPQGNRFVGLRRAPAERPTIALIGRVSPEKGVDVACRALATLRLRHGIDATLVIAGPVERSMRSEVERLIRELELDSQVQLLGPQDTPGLARVLTAAHAVLVPPTWEEPAPLVCVEAMLAKVPVIASRSGGIPEMLRDREHALLFEIGDGETCADLLAETLTRPAEAEERVERAFARAEELAYGPYIEATDRFLEMTMGRFANRAGAET
jgi:glycosyltransferase involved in cell wall biosynthesis